MMHHGVGGYFKQIILSKTQLVTSQRFAAQVKDLVSFGKALTKVIATQYHLVDNVSSESLGRHLFTNSLISLLTALCFGTA